MVRFTQVGASVWFVLDRGAMLCTANLSPDTRGVIEK